MYYARIMQTYVCVRVYIIIRLFSLFGIMFQWHLRLRITTVVEMKPLVVYMG